MSVAPACFVGRCVPPFWVRSGHAQTLLGHVLPSSGDRIQAGESGWDAFKVPLEDGEALRAYRHSGQTGVRVHLLHGLSGDVNSDYMRRTASALVDAGHEVWAINHRGCGTGRGLARQPYHSGKIEDLRDVLRLSRKLDGAGHHLVIGFSLSGNLALLYAARTEKPELDGLIAVNPPVDLELASRAIGKGFNRVYELRFLHRLLREVRRRRAEGGLRQAGRISRWGSLMEFDDRITVPTSGFRDGADYYAQCSSLPWLDKVHVPGVILTSADDPFVPPASFGTWQGSRFLRFHLEAAGGHVGYVDRGWREGRRWLDAALLDYVSELASKRSVGV